MGDLPYLDLVANGHKFFLTQQTLEGLPHLPGLENGPGFDSQGSVNFFTKYCFPNLHRIHVKAFEVEDCEFVPVHHQQKWHNILYTKNALLRPSLTVRKLCFYLVYSSSSYHSPQASKTLKTWQYQNSFLFHEHLLRQVKDGFRFRIKTATICEELTTNFGFQGDILLYNRN